MKKNLKEYFIVFIAIVGTILLIPSLRLFFLSIFEGDIKVENNNYQYKISYYDDKNSYYDILLYKNYVKVLEKEDNSEWKCFNPPCLSIKKYYRVKFDKKHMEIINENIMKLSSKFRDNFIYDSELNYYEQKIIKSIIKKDETYIDDYLSFYKED